jgi:hypothetical protein
VPSLGLGLGGMKVPPMGGVPGGLGLNLAGVGRSGDD